MKYSPLKLGHESALRQWIAAEPAHANNTLEFYVEPGCQSVVFSDDAGESV